MKHLDLAQIPYSLIPIQEHVVTALETAHVLNCEVSAILKSMVVYDANNPAAVCVVVLPGDQRLNLERIGEVLAYTKPKLLPMDKVMQIVGFSVGTLPPWGYLPTIKIYYESSIFNKNLVYAGSGDAKFLIQFHPKDVATLNTFRNT